MHAKLIKKCYSGSIEKSRFYLERSFPMVFVDYSESADLRPDTPDPWCHLYDSLVLLDQAMVAPAQVLQVQPRN